LSGSQFWPAYYDALGKPNGYNMREVACATARQRAEAFLRTIGKWKE
jgi:hypothetical protein